MKSLSLLEGADTPSKKPMPHESTPLWVGWQGDRELLCNALRGVVKELGINDANDEVIRAVAWGKYTPSCQSPSQWEGEAGVIYALACLMGIKQYEGRLLERLYSNNKQTLQRFRHFVKISTDAQDLEYLVRGMCDKWAKIALDARKKRR